MTRFMNSESIFGNMTSMDSDIVHEQEHKMIRQRDRDQVHKKHFGWNRYVSTDFPWASNQTAQFQ